MKNLLKLAPLSIAITSALLATTGCGSSSNKSNDEVENSSSNTASSSSTAPVETTVVSELSTGVDYKSRVWAYYDLDAGEIITFAEDEDPAANDKWDVAFKGTTVALNQHAKLYYTGNAADFYMDGTPIVTEFESPDIDAINTAFETFDGSTVAADTEFQSDVTERAIADYYIDDGATRTANPNAKFIVSSDGTYSQFYVSNLTQTGHYLADITLTIATQGAEAAEFDMAEELLVSAADCTGPVLIDLDEKSVAAADDNWELSIPCSAEGLSFNIDLADNATALFGSYADTSAINPASAGHFPWKKTEFTKYAIVEHGQPGTGYGWGEYGIIKDASERPLLSPNYSIFVIKTANADYKFQVVDYYNSEEKSGYYTFRFAPVSLP